ncbi:MAG: cell division protein FtsL [Lachnospiraceae bacterium]|nr:cell division protein FtsL [Lachnospiraceae bacterium]
MAERNSHTTVTRNALRGTLTAEAIYGNTARELRELDTSSYTGIRLSHQTRRNRERARHMNPGYVIFLTLAMIVTVVVCIQYLMLRSDVTNKVKELARLEAQLNEMKAENDDTENRITGAVDLEEVKYRAMNELGMQYAHSDQIVAYECEDTDYVRQLVDIE